nr:MAG TPA: hypothetical protein [Bacteriophage sp.]
MLIIFLYFYNNPNMSYCNHHILQLSITDKP